MIHHLISPSLRILLFSIIALATISNSAAGQEQRPVNVELTIDAIFAKKQFELQPVTGHWQSDSQGFERIKQDQSTGASSIVRLSLKSPTAEVILVPSDWLKPTSTSSPLSIDSYVWSADHTKILIFTNTKRKA